MILRTEVLAKRLKDSAAALKRNRKNADPLLITPAPDLQLLENAGAASLDLRLGCWFTELKRGSSELLDVDEIEGGEVEASITRRHYIPFERKFVLHPRTSVLAVTLEWIRMPKDLAGYVMTRSSWGRRGLVIATGSGVHPGFTGCLTLVLTNVGELPIALHPGIAICQFFLHQASVLDSNATDESPHFGKRGPTLGVVRRDKIANALIGQKPQSNKKTIPVKNNLQQQTDKPN
jgi:dCTP deaminase